MVALRSTLFQLLFLLAVQGIAQTISRYNSFVYSVNEGLLQTTMLDMAFDKNNFCWISFPAGIQKFDGKNFTTVPVQRGLPDDNGVYFFRTMSGELFVSHSQGVSLYDAEKNSFTYVLQSPPLPFTRIEFLGEADGVVHCLNTAGNVVGIDIRSHQRIFEWPTGLRWSSDSRLTVCESAVNSKTAIVLDDVVYRLDLANKKLLGRTPHIPGILRYYLAIETEDRVVFNEAVGDGIRQVSYDFATGKSESVALPVEHKHVFRSQRFKWQDKHLLSLYEHLYETDAGGKNIRAEMVNFQNTPVSASTVARMCEDNFGNLYVGTISGGLCKIIRNNFPIKYFGTSQTASNYALSLLPDKIRNRLLVGTRGEGLLIFDTAQKLVKHIKALPGRAGGFSAQAIVQSGAGDYYLFIWQEKGIWRLDANLRTFSFRPFEKRQTRETDGVRYFTKVLAFDDAGALVLSQSRLYRLRYAPFSVTETNISAYQPTSGLLLGNTVLTHAGDELLFLDASTFAERKRVSFKNTGDVRCFARKGTEIFIGSNKGIFVVDSAGNLLRRFTRENGLPDECIYAMAVDANGHLWCSSNKGLFRLNGGQSVLRVTKSDGLQENEFNTNAVAESADGEVYFGGINGVSSFYPAAINRFDDRPHVLLTALKVNNADLRTDSAVWNTKELVMPHDKNSFSFDFTAMGSANPDQYIYQYRMLGLEKDWVRSNGIQTVRYSLPPGNYRLQVAVSRQFDAAANPLMEIRLTVRPPFWKTWWFILIVAGCAAALLFLFINQQAKRRFEKKLQQLEADRKLQQERERISRDLHDSIGAYANAVLYDVELLEQENDEERKAALLGELKFTSKDIITSLRETVWALKKETFTAEECLVRIRNFVQALARHYTHIQFVVEGEAPARREMHYAKALNLVRMVQEAVTNSIKHASASIVMVQSCAQEQCWKMTVADNGRGFDLASAMAKAEGNGLQNLHERAAVSEFGLTITTNNKEGTSVSVVL